MTLPDVPGPEVLVREIVRHEWEMLLEAAADRPELVRQRPGTFQLQREIASATLAPDTLRAYLSDLARARLAGRNLLSEKATLVARHAPLAAHPFVGRIAAIETAWMAELVEQFPFTFKGELAAFSRAVACELALLSETTVTLIYRDVLAAREAGRNLERERYETLFRRLARGTLEEVEAAERAAVPDSI